MYQSPPGVVFGFHACDFDVGRRLVDGTLRQKASENKYDWLGHGMYFWESSPHRAERFGQELKERGKLADPCVVGAAIHLGLCFNLLESESLAILRMAYDKMTATLEAAGLPIPKNRSAADSSDLLLRELDCAVINYLHRIRKLSEQRPYDSVVGAFWEGEELYPGAGFREKNHIQICIRNPNCIKGYFWPRQPDPDYTVL